jgi:hypothetical protein
MDILEYRKYLEYLNIADIYVDSMPVGGFTVLLENAMRKIPIMFLDNHMSYPDCILKNPFRSLMGLFLTIRFWKKLER